MRIVIRGGRLVDPANGVDRSGDLCIADGRIAGFDLADFPADHTIDATGRIVCPGLIDLRAHTREPGQEYKGTIASETRAAAAGGITTLCLPPDTAPVIDSPAVVDLVNRIADEKGRARLHVIGALTQGLQGEQITEMHALKEAGCIAMSNAKQPLANTLVLRRSLEYAASLGLPIVLHAEDPWLAAGGLIHEGMVSTRLGLPGIPACAETIAVGRDLLLVEQAGVRAHFGQLSTAASVELIAEAQARGIPVTADVAIHQLYLTELDVGHFNALCHVRPPLRMQRDLEALRAALADGVISAVCSDHAPHDADAKLAPFPATEPGISGLETLLPLTLRLVDEGVLPLSEAIGKLTTGPAKALGLDAGTLSVGAVADVCVFDPEACWTVDADRLQSRGKNTPFIGWEMKGRVTHTLLEGDLVYEG